MRLRPEPSSLSPSSVAPDRSAWTGVWGEVQFPPVLFQETWHVNGLDADLLLLDGDLAHDDLVGGEDVVLVEDDDAVAVAVVDVVEAVVDTVVVVH